MVQGLGRALGLAAGWGWAGAAQVGAGWATEGRVEKARAVEGMEAEGMACRCHRRGIISCAAAASTMEAWLTGILQRHVIIKLAA